MSWLKEFLESTKDLEPPQDFFFWAGASAIAGVVKGNVLLNRFSYYLYPNIYVMLIANSGLRKGIPISYARRMVAKVDNNRVIIGRNSIQAVISKLAKAHMTDSGTMIKDSTAYLVSGEFTNFLHHDPFALNALTDLYDTGYHDAGGWVNSLKTSSDEVLKKVNLTMLGATSPVHFRDVIHTKDIEGGFIARTYLIYAKDKHTLNSLVKEPDNVPDVDELVKYLKTLSRLEGRFQWVDDAASFYDKWYIDYNNKKRDKKLEDRTGTSNRFEDHILKVAMILSLSKRTDLKITKADLEESIDVCFNFLTSLDQMMMSSGSDKSSLADQSRVILRELVISGPAKWISRKEILRRSWGDVSATDLSSVIDTFSQAGVVIDKLDKGDQHYKLSEEAYKIYVGGGTND